MKATELRIGNYVELRGETTTIWKVSKETIHAEPFDCPMCDEIKPIPLTEEWLLKFGFEKHLNYWMIPSKGFFIGVTLNNEIYPMFDTDNPIPIKTLKYVHQLQNLYFALTGQELTIK